MSRVAEAAENTSHLPGTEAASVVSYTASGKQASRSLTPADLLDAYWFASILNEITVSAKPSVFDDELHAELCADFYSPDWIRYRRSRWSKTQGPHTEGPGFLDKELGLITKYADIFCHTRSNLCVAVAAILSRSPKEFYNAFFEDVRPSWLLKHTQKRLAKPESYPRERLLDALSVLQSAYYFNSDADLNDAHLRSLWDPETHRTRLKPSDWSRVRLAPHFPTGLLDGIRYTDTIHYHPETPRPNPCTLILCECESDCTLNSNQCACGRTDQFPAFDASGRLHSEFSGAIYECGLYCACPLTCGRRRVQQSQIPLDKLELFWHPQKGVGVRTTQDIPKGTFICEYSGEKISERVAKIRSTVCAHAGIGMYMFQLDYGGKEGGQGHDSEWCIDAMMCGNISRFFNHSCDGGNLRKVILFAGHLQQDEQRICFFTSRNVRKGEELTFDYGAVQFEACACGSGTCRGGVGK